MEGASAVPPPPALPLPAAAPHATPPTPGPVPPPPPVSTPTATPAPTHNPAAIPPARQAPAPGPQQSGPGLPTYTNNTAEAPPLTPGLPPGLLALFQSRTHDNSPASRLNATSTTAASVPNRLGSGHENHHYAAIPPRPEPLSPAAPRVQAQPPLRTQPEPEPAMITSDIVEASTPTPPAAPQPIAHHGPQPAAAAAVDSSRSSTATTPLDTPDQKRRDALRMALKSESCPLRPKIPLPS